MSDKDEAAAVAKDRTERYAEGLAAELEGYRRSGDEDHEAQVVAELRRIGAKVPARDADSKGPAGRRQPPAQTT